MTALVIDNIGLLITHDPELGDQAQVSLVMEGGCVVAVEQTGAAGDVRLDARGMCVIPGFVDSHTHLVFAGDRSAEFAARMAGAPYRAGGIRETVRATRQATLDELRELAAARRHEALRAGITTLEVKSGYALDVPGERRLCQVASEFTDEVTFLGAHVVPAEYQERPDDYVSLVSGQMLQACAPSARWVDAFCERGAFDVDQCREVLLAGRRAGLGVRVHANQLGPGPGVRLAVELGAASADHCTHLKPDDITALSGSDTVATLLPATDFSTRQPYPDARALIDAGVTVALATNCNPGSSYTTSMAFCIALGVREMGMSIREAVGCATLGGARALRRDDVGHLGLGARADAVLLAAPSPDHLVYRPGVPLVAATVLGGRVAWTDPDLAAGPANPGPSSAPPSPPR
ncbi:MAG TPA: imidazolonepropionase [Solirubrobacteraceae bacterium]|nr:imidazolonepropionase [Solirubrobacteraceae bacterium]